MRDLARGARRWLLAAAACCALSGGRADDAAPAKVPAVFAAYVTPVAEPWNAVTHAALVAARDAGRITYRWKADLGTAEKQLDAVEEAVTDKPDVLVTDAADAEEELLALARHIPGSPFCLAARSGRSRRTCPCSTPTSPSRPICAASWRGR